MKIFVPFFLFIVLAAFYGLSSSAAKEIVISPCDSLSSETYLQTPGEQTLLLDSFFEIRFDNSTKRFSVHCTSNKLEIQSRPAKGLTVYYSGSASLGITGDILSMDTMAFQGHGYTGDEDDDLVPENFQYSASGICRDYNSTERRRPFLRLTMVTDKSLLVEYGFSEHAVTYDEGRLRGRQRAYIRLYNFETRRWSNKEKGVLRKAGRGYELYQFRKDSVYMNDYGDIYYERAWSPDKVRKVYFSDEKGIQKAAPDKISRENLDMRCHELDISSGILYEDAPAKEFWGGPEEKRLKAIKATREIVMHPHPSAPVIYREKDSLYAEGYNGYDYVNDTGYRSNLRYTLNGRNPRPVNWSVRSFYSQHHPGDHVFHVERETQNLLAIRYNEADSQVFDSTQLDWMKHPECVGYARKRGRCGIYDMDALKWLVAPEYDDVSVQNGYLLAMRNFFEPFDVKKHGSIENAGYSPLLFSELVVYNEKMEEVARSRNAPFFPDVFAKLYGMDSIVPYRDQAAYCYKDGRQGIAALYRPGAYTIPVYEMLVENAAGIIPFIDLQPGSYVTFNGDTAHYVLTENKSASRNAELVHSNRFEFVSRASCSGFMRYAPYNPRSLLATDDYQPPYFPEVVSFTETNQPADRDAWSMSIVAGVERLPGNRAIIHNKIVRDANASLSLFIAEEEILDSPPDLPDTTITSRSGAYDILTQRWLIQPVYERFILRYNGITAIGFNGKETVYDSFDPEFRHKETVKARTLSELIAAGKASLLYTGVKIDTILRGPNVIAEQGGSFLVSPYSFYKSGQRYGVLMFGESADGLQSYHSPGNDYPLYFPGSNLPEQKNKCIIGNAYDAIAEFPPGYLIVIDGDSVRLGGRAWPLQKMEINAYTDNYGDYYFHVIAGGDTTWYRDGYRDLYKITDDRGESLSAVVSSAFIDIGFMAVCNYPVAYSVTEPGSRKLLMSGNLPVNSSALWVKGDDGYVNVIGFSTNLVKNASGYSCNGFRYHENGRPAGK